MKRPTKWYAREKNKPGGLSSYQIAEKVKKEYDSFRPHPATIHCYVNANLVSMSPLKVGVKGDVPLCFFKLLCMAFESYVWIQQFDLCEGDITFKKLTSRINAVLYHNYWPKMLQRVLLATSKNLDATTMHIAEDHRVWWTTYTNIASWFDNWEWDFVELGFATRGNDEKVKIPEDQLCFIINFDETCLSLEGTEGRRGGPLEITLHNPRLPYNGKQTNKDSLVATLVCGSNAAGKALSPHFQFQTKAMTDKGQ